ncbi:MAG: hypothetical protein LW816_12650 [Planctomyces sp.]|nr:hypothetical protein [Planctomyces sp.]
MAFSFSDSRQGSVWCGQRALVPATLLLCSLLFCSTANAQKPGKPKGMKPGQESGQRGGGRGRNEPLLSEQLPAPFQGISNEDLPVLQQVVLRAKRWILYDTAPESPFAPVRVRFAAAESGENLQVGLLILAKLTLEQRKLLASILADTISDQQKISQLDQQLSLVLQKVREQKQLNRLRALEAEARRDLQELGRVEGTLAARQARIFAQLEKGLSNEQRESLLLASASSFVPESGLPDMHEVEAELRNADGEQRDELKRMACRVAAWTAMQANAAPVDSSEQLPSKKERSPDPQLQNFLKALLPPQQEELRKVFDAELRRQRQQQQLKAAAMASLQGLRSSRSLDEKNVQQSTVACAQLQFTVALAETVSFETIRQSVSKQQLEYLTGSGEQ